MATQSNAPVQQNVGKFKTDRSVKLPDYDGTGDVHGFVRLFNFSCDRLYFGHPVPPERKKAYLLSQLKGPAELWLEGIQEDWRAWSY